MYKAKLELKQPNYITGKLDSEQTIPYKLKGEMEHQIASMLKAGVIEHDHPQSYRFVVDWRSANQ